MTKDNRQSRPIALQRVRITDEFWQKEMELVRNEVIPYQWDTLNDRVEGAAPSFCMRNFKVAAKLMQEKRDKGSSFIEPTYTFRGIEVLPKDYNNLEDKFYGYVFQDSDFSKWIEAVAYCLTWHPDTELESLADSAIDTVCAAQQEDGYLDTYYIINGMDGVFTNLKDNHELYCFGHLAEGAVAYYQATGKTKLLQAAGRYADYIEAHFGIEEGKLKGYPGHEIAEMALVRLFEATGEEKYVKLARFFIDERGKTPYYFDKETGVLEETPGMRYQYHQAHLPVREQREALGHAVRAVYLYAGMADVARVTGDKSLAQACEKLWEDIVYRKMYITGGIGSTHIGEAFTFPYDLPNDTVYAETCASIGLVFFASRMLHMKPDSRYADVMELALHNGILSGMALDGKSFFYVNPLQSVPKACREDPGKAHVKPVRQKWFGCACCPPNLARLVSSIGSYAYSENEDTVFIHLYAGGTLEKEINGQNVSVKITSGFPWDGHVTVTVTAPQPAEMTLALRIPGWCSHYELEKRDDLSYEEENGYLYIKGRMGENAVRIYFPMPVRVMQAGAQVRADMGKVALQRGPVVYCMEEKDNGPDLYLYRLHADRPVEEMQTGIQGNPAVILKTQGERMVPEDADGQETSLYTPYRLSRWEEVPITWIPYYMWANRGEGEMQVFTDVSK